MRLWLNVIVLLFCAGAFLRTSAQQTNVQPIDLPTVLRLAGAQNLDVQIARQKLVEAKANHQSTVWQFFPWIAPGVSYRRHDDLLQDVGGNVIDVHKQSYTVGPTLVAQVDLGDSLYKNLVSRQLMKAADYGVESQRLVSVLEAAQAYFDLVNAAAESAVLRDSLKISEDYQRQLHDAVGAGIAFKGDELRSQVQTEHYQIAVRQSLERERLIAARLAQNLHLDPFVNLAAEDKGLEPLILVQTNTALDSLVSQALRSRPEILQSEALASAAHDEEKGSIYGPLIPTVSGQAFVGGLGGGPRGGPETFGSSEDYAIGLAWRVGPGGLFDTGRKRAAQAKLEIASLNKSRIAESITRQVVETFTRVQSLADQLVTSKTSLATASESLKLSIARKEFGVAAVLERIQAEQDLTRARSEYLKTVAEHNKAQYGLYAAIGHLAER